jgi:ferredoxin
MDRTRITVSAVKCQGFGRCAALAPAVFSLGGDGKVKVSATEVAFAQATIDAARSCPYRAIIVSDAATDQQIFPPPKRRVSKT